MFGFVSSGKSNSLGSYGSSSQSSNNNQGIQLKHRRRRFILVILISISIVLFILLLFCKFSTAGYKADNDSVGGDADSTGFYDKNTRLRLQETIKNLEDKIISDGNNKAAIKFIPPDNENVHYVMTTDCGRYSDWQSIIAYNSLRKTGFKGNFTRLIACEKKPERVLSHSTYFSDYFITPFFGNNPGPDFFPPLAKPNSIMSWIEDGPGRFIHDDQQIVLIDQDFISLDYLKPQAPCGFPMAQKYGMGDGFLYDGTADKYCRGKCKNFKGKIDDYLVGPPYMMCMGDLRKIGVLWRDITREITKNSKYGQHNKEWLSDMYGYIMGSIILGLPHITRVDWMISVAETSDEWSDFYKAGLEAQRLGRTPLKVTPTLHVCQGYEVPLNDGSDMVLKFNKHEFHERDMEGLLNCDPEISKKRLFNTLLGKKKEKELLLSELPFTVPKFEEALEATIQAKSKSSSSKYSASEARLMRNKWAIGTFITEAESAFKEYRRRICVEPMNDF